MEYRNLGTSGLRVSTVGLGCNNFGMRLDLEGTRAVVDRAIEKGITYSIQLICTAHEVAQKSNWEKY